jgi:hypothetical protein
MGASNAEFQQPLKVYRGLAYTDEPNTEKLGMHWTTNPNVAHDFASDEPYWKDTEDDEPAPKGIVLEAEVRPEHEIQPGTPEHDDVMDSDAVIGPSHYERERTIRPGAPIRVTRHHYIKDGKIVRSEDVNYEGRA